MILLGFKPFKFNCRYLLAIIQPAVVTPITYCIPKIFLPYMELGQINECVSPSGLLISRVTLSLGWIISGNNKSPRDPSEAPLMLMYLSKSVLTEPRCSAWVKALRLLVSILYYEASSLMRPTKLSARWTNHSHLLSPISLLLIL